MRRIVAVAVILLVILISCSKGEPPELAVSTPTPSARISVTPKVTPTAKPTPEPTPEPSAKNPLTGEVLEEALANVRPFTLAINNIVDSIPQCGTADVDILYEMLAEGGISRMLAVFSQLPEDGVFGSIRSIRPYFIDIAMAYDGILVHAGGSVPAYTDIANKHVENIDGVNGLFADQIYYRDTGRLYSGYAWEQCLFTSSKLILEYLPQLGYRTEHEGDEAFDYRMSFREDGAPANGETARSVNVTFQGGKRTDFSYNETDGVYYVRQYSRDYVDGNTNEKVGFTNVLVLNCDTVNTGDSLGHIDIKTTGSGTGYYASGAAIEEISWSRDENAPFVYKNAEGEELQFGVGKSYICLVPSVGSTVQYS